MYIFFFSLSLYKYIWNFSLLKANTDLTWHVALTRRWAPHASPIWAQDLQLEREIVAEGAQLPVAVIACLRWSKCVCVLRGPAEPWDALRGRLPVVPPSHWCRPDALNLLRREARRWSLTHPSQLLGCATRMRPCFQSQIWLDVEWNTRGNHFMPMYTIVSNFEFRTFLEWRMCVFEMGFSWPQVSFYVSVPGQKCHTCNPCLEQMKTNQCRDPCTLACASNAHALYRFDVIVTIVGEAWFVFTFTLIMGH